MNINIYKEEEEHLLKVNNIINKQLEELKAKFSEQQNTIIGFTEGLRGTQFNRQAFMSMYATNITNINNIKNNPYFGRFDIKENNKEKNVIYIGKTNVVDEQQNTIIYDWRSKVGSLYYDYNIGEKIDNIAAGLDLDDASIVGKRQIKIKNGKLLDVSDSDILSTDEILIKCLNDQSNYGLKSIIATIQKEQNKIIRNSIKSSNIIQGVAGSGKTTVALHRIAYLLYQEAKNINESNFLIIGPNKFFLNYISSLLPDLDISGIKQMTFEELAKTNIKTKAKVKSKYSEMKEAYNNEILRNINKFKNSKEYMKLIEQCVEEYIKSNLNRGLEYEGVTIIAKEKMEKFLGIYSYSNKSYKEKIDNFIKKNIQITKENSENICSKLWELTKEKLKQYDSTDPRRRQIIEEYEKQKTEIKKGCPKEIKQFFSFIKTPSIKLYEEFINNNEKFKLIKENTQSNSINKELSVSDLTAIFMIDILLKSKTDDFDYKHIIIDEAQDLSEAQYYILNKIFPKSNFDIYGDINQSIYDIQSINDWNDIKDIFPKDKFEKQVLNKGYRNTYNIVDVSNQILKELNSEESTCVMRSGESVKINNIEYKNNVEIKIKEILELKEKRYNNIAIICKTVEEVENLYKQLKKEGMDINKITKEDDPYIKGINIIPVYLSKGIEFEAVIINNASDLIYDEKINDQKLLYVAVTRPIQELIIDYEGKISKSLEQYVNKKELGESNKKLIRKI